VKDSWEKTIKQKWCSELPDQFDVTGTSFEHGLFFYFSLFVQPIATSIRSDLAGW